jgi:hypothetical protein
VPSPAAAAVTDLEILNFGLRFEYLQATFYTQADELGTIKRMIPRKQEWAHVLGAHERAHVKILKSVLGPKAAKRPFFDFHGTTETDDAFTRTAVAMEDLTVALLAGVTPQIQDRGLTAALFGLLTVEARHAAWARNIVGATPAAAAFDDPRSLGEVRTVVRRTGFVVQRPSTTGDGRPSVAPGGAGGGGRRRRAGRARGGLGHAGCVRACDLDGTRAAAPGEAGLRPGSAEAARLHAAPVELGARPPRRVRPANAEQLGHGGRGSRHTDAGGHREPRVGDRPADRRRRAGLGTGAPPRAPQRHDGLGAAPCARRL